MIAEKGGIESLQQEYLAKHKNAFCQIADQ
jgi:hypothetical protein